MIERYRKWAAIPRHSERGSGLVEFALAAAFLLTIVFGILDFGRAMFTYDLVANAARLGSRYAIVRGSACGTSGCQATTAQIIAYVRAQSPGVDTTKLTVTFPSTTQPAACNTGAGFPGGPGCIIAVSVSYPFNFIAFPYAQIAMTSVSQMAISQ